MSDASSSRVDQLHLISEISENKVDHTVDETNVVRNDDENMIYAMDQGVARIGIAVESQRINRFRIILLAQRHDCGELLLEIGIEGWEVFQLLEVITWTWVVLDPAFPHTEVLKFADRQDIMLVGVNLSVRTDRSVCKDLNVIVSRWNPSVDCATFE